MNRMIQSLVSKITEWLGGVWFGAAAWERLSLHDPAGTGSLESGVSPSTVVDQALLRIRSSGV
jgi:hypothetical protein